jgi:hypothetical protein
VTRYQQREKAQVEKIKKAIKREMFFKQLVLGVCLCVIVTSLIWAAL